MSLQFAPNVTGNVRGEIQLFIKNKVDRDTDVYTMVRSSTPGTYGLVTAGWHTGDDPQGQHFTIQLYQSNRHLATAHVYQTGQVTEFSA
jgi:hypothetical protein